MRNLSGPPLYPRLVIDGKELYSLYELYRICINYFLDEVGVSDLHLGNISALTIHRQSFYYVVPDQTAWKIMSMDREEGLEKQVKTMTKKVFSLAVYDKSMQVGSNGCTIADDGKGGCEHLCVPVEAGRRECLCSLGYHTNQTNPSQCAPIPDFLLYVNDNRIQVINIS